MKKILSTAFLLSLFLLKMQAQNSIFYTYDNTTQKYIPITNTILGVNKGARGYIYITAESKKIIYKPKWLYMFNGYIERGIYGYSLETNAYNAGEDRADSIVLEDQKDKKHYVLPVTQTGCRFSADTSFDFLIAGPHLACSGSSNNYAVKVNPQIFCNWYNKNFMDLDGENFSTYNYNILAYNASNASVVFDTAGKYIISLMPGVACKLNNTIFDTLHFDEVLHLVQVSSKPPIKPVITEVVKGKEYKLSGYTFEKIDWYKGDSLLNNPTPRLVSTPRQGRPVYAVSVDSVLKTNVPAGTSLKVRVFNGCDSIQLEISIVTNVFEENLTSEKIPLVSPNPSAGKFSITSPVAGVYPICIYNSYSKIVYEGIGWQGKNFDLELPSGIYCIHAGHIAQKVVIE